MVTVNTAPEPKAEIPVLKKPFEHIALAFSGGGFRAGAFGQGVLSFLNYVQLRESGATTLLDKVTYLSSASGGTIATAMYALYNVQDKPFSEYYRDMYERMYGTQLVEEALRILNSPDEWKNRPGKSRNLINSFALAYNRLLFDGATVGDLRANPDTHLEEVCFNSTELYNGLLFRQAIMMKTPPEGHNEGFLYGNFGLHLDHSTADTLYIADLLAASSCFPGGFEPIVFPKDFAGPLASKNELLKGLNIALQEVSWEELNLLYNRNEVEGVFHSMPKPVDVNTFAKKITEELPLNDHLKISLMDGGITDNQGLESMIIANDRRVKGKTGFPQFDLMMVCDVGSHFMDAYQLPKQSPMSWWTINRIRRVSVISALVLIAFAAYAFLTHCGSITWSILGTAAVLIAFIPAFIYLFSNKVKRYISGQVSGGSGLNLEKTFSVEIVALLFRHFANLRLNFLRFMIVERLTSLLTLTGDVFLKRIRYLLYDQFFNQNNLKRTGRAKANHIYDLSFTNDVNRIAKYSDQCQPSRHMQIVAEAAFTMGTTLWFSKTDREQRKHAAVIATGQFTTCFNLLDYIHKLKTSFEGQPPVFDGFSLEDMEMVNNLQDRLEKLFDAFKEDPFWLYNKFGKDYEIRNFHTVNMENFPFPDAFKDLR